MQIYLFFWPVGGSKFKQISLLLLFFSVKNVSCNYKIELQVHVLWIK